LDQDLAAGIGWTRGAAAPVAGTGVLRRRVAGVTRKRVLGHGLGSGGTHETRANYSRVQGGLQRVERGLLRRGGTAAQQHMTASKINAAQREERRGNRLRELPHQHDMLQGRAASEIGGIASNSWWRGGLVSFRQGKSQYSAGWREVDVPGVELHHLTKLRQCAGVGEGLRGGGFAMEQWRLCAPSTMQPWRLGLRWRRWV